MNGKLTPDEQKRRFADLFARLVGADEYNGTPIVPPLAVAEDLAQPRERPANDNGCTGDTKR
ncbi:hypothetical protein HCU64_20935 [Methylobacterium sp. C25]|uniref:hypothetical protein n=1 Tax=Methylobacterium sp. C25 TaxID=2721622 RepID=UPI001F23A98F|nr:hypothetical protein [Methylobacterium sp. C25]MCE4226220.1 hypothetical protein [Methylobacterium sp. C25]